MAGDAHDTSVGDTFAEVARLLVAEHTATDTLARIGRLAVETVDGCDHAGVSLVERRKVITVGASDEVPALVDAIQYEVDDGPCLDAIRRHEIFIVEQLSTEKRWPRFSARAAQETGVESMLALRLFVESDTMGALNLYSRKPNAFSADAQAMGTVLAAHAAVALSAARREDELHEALGSRDMIGQAKGMLMAREGVTADEAFDTLRRASQRLNMKLRDVAERVTRGADEPHG